MKFTVITVCYNSEATIERCLKSVDEQTYPDIEHIIIDGASKDGTMRLVDAMVAPNRIAVSEPDKGLYDAMNKGIARATGDYIGCLNSDDMFNDPQAISRLAAVARETRAEAVNGDVLISAEDGSGNRRLYSGAGRWKRLLRIGWQPPHPGFYARADLLKRIGFATDMKIAADFEMFVKFFFRENATNIHVPGVTVLMAPGGLSTQSIWSNFTINSEIVKGCRRNDVYTNLFMVYSKYAVKIVQLVTGRGAP